MLGLGRVLVVLGVAVWPAWGVMFLAGQAPSVLWALLVHLALVIPGGVIARRHGPHEARPRKRIGEVLIAVGVLAWVPYFILTDQGVDVPSWPFLTWHLLGVIPGALLRYTRWGERQAASSAEARRAARGGG